MKTRMGRKRQGKEREHQVKGKRTEGKSRKVPGTSPENRARGQPVGRAVRRRRLWVPPPDSEVWPPEYRGQRWKRAYGILFAGKCLLCQYAFQQPESRRIRDRWLRQRTPLFCVSHPDWPGELSEVLGTDTCRNFKAKRWLRPRAKPAPRQPRSTLHESDPNIRRILVGTTLFATVDVADYRKVRQHRWYAQHCGHTTYAFCRIKGRTVYMHRMLMRPRQGYVVDHLDGNGLNNCRCNLRPCKPWQNLANRGPRGGSSRFVGVTWHAGKWEAKVISRGQRFYLGRFEDEVEAAKARDRKAVELHGVYVYLNFPEDWTFDKKGVGHPVRPVAKSR